jgi:hypothetical protein
MQFDTHSSLNTHAVTHTHILQREQQFKHTQLKHTQLKHAITQSRKPELESEYTGLERIW